MKILDIEKGSALICPRSTYGVNGHGIWLLSQSIVIVLVYMCYCVVFLRCERDRLLCGFLLFILGRRLSVVYLQIATLIDAEGESTM